VLTMANHILGTDHNCQYFCMLIAYKGGGEWFAKTSVADNFDMIVFSLDNHINSLVSNASITAKYIGFMLINVDRGPYR